MNSFGSYFETETEPYCQVGLTTPWWDQVGYEAMPLAIRSDSMSYGTSFFMSVIA